MLIFILEVLFFHYIRFPYFFVVISAVALNFIFSNFKFTFI